MWIAIGITSPMRVAPVTIHAMALRRQATGCLPEDALDHSVSSQLESDEPVFQVGHRSGSDRPMPSSALGCVSIDDIGIVHKSNGGDDEPPLSCKLVQECSKGVSRILPRVGISGF